MADEEKKVKAGNVAAKSVKKKTVKKAAKKSVKKKSVKKATKKTVKKTTAAASAANGNGQKEKAKIRLKDNSAQKVTTSAAVRSPVKQKKDRLGLLSTLSIVLLIIIGVWTVVSYMTEEEVISEVTTEAPAVVEAIIVEQAAVAEAVESTEAAVQVEENPGLFDILFGEKKQPAEEAVATEAPATAESTEAVEQAEETPGVFDILFGAKEQPAEEAAATVPVAETAVTEAVTDAVVAEEAAESAEVATQKEEATGFLGGLFGGKKEASEEAVAEEATASKPVAPSTMPQAYGQPAPWGPPPGYGQPAPAPQGYAQPAPWGPPQDYGPPPGFYDMPPRMPMYDQGPRW